MLLHLKLDNSMYLIQARSGPLHPLHYECSFWDYEIRFGIHTNEAIQHTFWLLSFFGMERGVANLVVLILDW